MKWISFPFIKPVRPLLPGRYVIFQRIALFDLVISLLHRLVCQHGVIKIPECTCLRNILLNTRESRPNGGKA